MNPNGWLLEVIKGKDVGKRYALASSETTRLLGNALNGAVGIDLSDQEASGVRKMAARQAILEQTSSGQWSIRDLDSPVGTLVNRQRVLPNQSRLLQPGDLVQLASVQLLLVSESSSPPSAPPSSTKSDLFAPAPAPVSTDKPTSFVYTMANGVVCRSWDDFLKISTQRWSALRDELSSGRLASFLTTQGRHDLVPHANALGTLDERLDQWLSRLPTKLTNQPELEIHPERLAIKLTSGGGLVTRKLRISNIGYRLLRCTSIKVEPANTSWIRIPDPYGSKPFQTVDDLEIPIEIQLPDSPIDGPWATIIVSSNGGTKQTPVVLEAPTKTTEPNLGQWSPSTATDPWNVPWRTWLGGFSFPNRLLMFGGGALALRAVTGATNLMLANLGWLNVPEQTHLSIDLLGSVFILGVIGAIVGCIAAKRKQAISDMIPLAFSAAIGGVLVAAIFGALIKIIESGMDFHPWLELALGSIIWGGLGCIGAWLSVRIEPPGLKLSSLDFVGKAGVKQ